MTPSQSHIVSFDQVAEGFIEQIWPRVHLQKTAVIVVGTVSSRQPYLPRDHSRIFTEFAVDVESLLKTDRELAPSTRSLTLDRLGGALRRASGRVVRDGIMLCGLGWPEVGGRYVLFARRIHDGKDLEFFHGYRLVDGKALPIVPRPGVTSRPDPLVSEASLLESIKSWAAEDESVPCLITLIGLTGTLIRAPVTAGRAFTGVPDGVFEKSRERSYDPPL